MVGAAGAAAFGGEPDTSGVLAAEAALGDSGIVMLDTADPICLAADLFSMGDYTVAAATEPALFHRLLERYARVFWPKTEAVAAALPGRLWRIYGPEYASVPYLHPRFFREYVVRYDTPMVQAIQRHGGFARLHCHGRLKAILDDIAATGCDGLDPIEPPPQGDIDLRTVREKIRPSRWCSSATWRRAIWRTCPRRSSRAASVGRSQKARRARVGASC